MAKKIKYPTQAEINWIKHVLKNGFDQDDFPAVTGRPKRKVKKDK